MDTYQILAAALRDILKEKPRALSWGDPEQWLQAELYARLDHLAAGSEHAGYHIFDCELPIVTTAPVRPPKLSNRDWRVDGAVKWVDLVMLDKAARLWTWIELKTRSASAASRVQAASRSAIDALVKDFVALEGFDPTRTARLWQQPDESTKAYWFTDVLEPQVASLESASHRYIALLLEIGREGSELLSIGEEDVRDRIRTWRTSRRTGTTVPIRTDAFEFQSSEFGTFRIAACMSSSQRPEDAA